MNTPYFKPAIVFSDHNVSIEGNIVYLPIYMTVFLEKEERIGRAKHIDLSQLRVRWRQLLKMRFLYHWVHDGPKKARNEWTYDDINDIRGFLLI